MKEDITNMLEHVNEGYFSMPEHVKRNLHKMKGDEMSQQKFDEIISKIPSEFSKDPLFKIMVKGIISRTLRLTLEHPVLARNYYESLPKATMEYLDKTQD